MGVQLPLQPSQIHLVDSSAGASGLGDGDVTVPPPPPQPPL